MVKKLSSRNVVFFADCWHMTDSSLRKTFGLICYNLLKGHLCGMIDAGTKEQLEETLSAEKSCFNQCL